MTGTGVAALTAVIIAVSIMLPGFVNESDQACEIHCAVILFLSFTGLAALIYKAFSADRVMIDGDSVSVFRLFKKINSLKVSDIKSVYICRYKNLGVKYSFYVLDDGSGKPAVPGKNEKNQQIICYFSGSREKTDKIIKTYINSEITENNAEF